MAELTERIVDSKEKEGSGIDRTVLEHDIRRRIGEIVSGKTASDSFYGYLLDHLIAYPGRRVEVHLKGLPTIWTYVLENPKGIGCCTKNDS